MSLVLVPQKGLARTAVCQTRAHVDSVGQGLARHDQPRRNHKLVSLPCVEGEAPASPANVFHAPQPRDERIWNAERLQHFDLHAHGHIPSMREVNAYGKALARNGSVFRTTGGSCGYREVNSAHNKKYEVA